jgi:hypothetical protein
MFTSKINNCCFSSIQLNYHYPNNNSEQTLYQIVKVYIIRDNSITNLKIIRRQEILGMD